MKLTNEEIAWIDDLLAFYEIKFQEVYDELRDHILTAIENLRAEGDMRPVNVLFGDVLQKQFPGYWPFEDIVKQYQKAYRHKIRLTMWAHYKHYLNWQTVPVMLLAAIAGFYLPHTKPVMIVLMSILFLVSVAPVIYVYRMARHIRVDDGRKSLVKNDVMVKSNMLMMMFNLLFNGIGGLAKDWPPTAFLNPAHYPPVVFIVLIGLACIYALSCVRLSEQEFKMIDLANEVK